MATRDHVLNYLRSQRYQPLKTRALARFFDIREEEYDQFRSLIKGLVAEGEIAESGRGKLVPAEKLKRAEGTFTGVLRLSAKGFGFIEPDDPEMKEDVFVPPGDTLDAITGDRVVARRVKRKFQKKGQLPFTGKVLEVLSRGQKRFVGTYRLRGQYGSIKPDGGLLLIDDIPVPDATSSGAKPNDKVVFELLKYPAQHQAAEAVIVEVLGPRGEPGVDTLAIIRQFDLPDEFPEEVLESARRAVERFTAAELANRTDLRELLVVTVDPVTARDFDDAVSIQHLDGGLTRLGVHIADVSFFVRPGGPLDAEAFKRGNSVYLPTEVLPMLPELLSNGMCSLQEGQERLVQSAFMDLDAEARVVRTSFANAVIRNKKRLTYEQVNEVLDEGRRDIVEPEVAAFLQEMNVLARRILARRRRQEYLELDLPQVDLVFDNDGRVIDAKPEDQSFSHKIIEMFMVEANEAVARHLAQRHMPFIRRVHENPTELKLDNMSRFVHSCGYELRNPGDRGEIQRLLKTSKGTPAAYPIHLAVLRSMMQAKYSLEDAGHWALGSQCYCHFTSPIRRYPDLAVHRGLAQVEGWQRGGTLFGEVEEPQGRRGLKAGVEIERLKETAAHCSVTERRAEAAERELTKVKVLTLLEQHLGEEFTGVVTSVADYGMFVEIHKYLIEGMVHAADLQDDVYEFDPRTFTLAGRKSGRKLRVGDSFHVKIAAVDIPRRELDLVPAAESPHATPPVERAKKAASGKKGGSEKKSASNNGQRSKSPLHQGRQNSRSDRNRGRRR